MSDERYYEKTFEVVSTVTVTAQEPLTLVNQRVIETLVRTTLGKLEGLNLLGVDAPSARVKSTWAKVEEVTEFKPEISPVIILGMKKGEALVLTDDALILLDQWHKEQHLPGEREQTLVRHGLKEE
jgi:hypothetical protein